VKITLFSSTKHNILGLAVIKFSMKTFAHIFRAFLYLKDWKPQFPPVKLAITNTTIGFNKKEGRNFRNIWTMNFETSYISFVVSNLYCHVVGGWKRKLSWHSITPWKDPILCQLEKDQTFSVVCIARATVSNHFHWRPSLILSTFYRHLYCTILGSWQKPWTSTKQTTICIVKPTWCTFHSIC
jgi:hypothetical protein